MKFIYIYIKKFHVHTHTHTHTHRIKKVHLFLKRQNKILTFSEFFL